MTNASPIRFALSRIRNRDLLFESKFTLLPLNVVARSGIMSSRPWFQIAMRPCMVELLANSADFRLIGVSGSRIISGISSFTWETSSDKWISCDVIKVKEIKCIYHIVCIKPFILLLFLLLIYFWKVLHSQSCKYSPRLLSCIIDQ